MSGVDLRTTNFEREACVGFDQPIEFVDVADVATKLAKAISRRAQVGADHYCDERSQLLVLNGVRRKVERGGASLEQRVAGPVTAEERERKTPRKTISIRRC